MKLCMNCIYISNDGRTKEEILCIHPKLVKNVDVIDGQKYCFTCYEARSKESLCGKEARLYESEYK